MTEEYEIIQTYAPKELIEQQSKSNKDMEESHETIDYNVD